MQVANKHLEKADRLLQKGKLEAALGEFLLAWKEEPANDGIVYTVAQLYHQLNKSKESRECYLFLYDRALEKGAWQRVLDLLSKFQVLGPLEPSRVLAAAHLLELHKPDVAAEQYQGLMASAGEQNLELALQSLEGLTRLDPDSMELHHRLATLAERLGNTGAAIAGWRTIASLALTAEKPQERAEALEQVCRLDPKDQEARIALAHTYLKSGQATKIQDLLGGTPAAVQDREVLSLLAEAHAAAGALSKAEELYWNAWESFPGASGELLKIARSYAAESKFDLLSALLGRLEDHLNTSRAQNGFIPLAEGLSKLNYQETGFLERLARVLDRLHLDSPLAATLSALFDLHCNAGRFQEAAGVLDRIVTVDPYNQQGAARLERLKDHLDASELHNLGERLGIHFPPADGSATGGATPGMGGSETEAGSAGASLRDLMLQAEIFLQYGMRDKAHEKLARIRGLFPDEEQHNSELAALLERAGLSVATEPVMVDTAAAAPSEERHIQPDLKRVSEITRDISRQGTAKAVLSAAVNGIGRHWHLSRCVAGLTAPNRPPSLVLEYISPGVPPSDAARLGKLVAGLQQAAPGKGLPLVAESVQQSPALAPLQDTLAALQVDSLVCIPLRDGEQEMGVLILEQCGEPRRWKPNDLSALEGIAEQVVLAVANVRLRSLVKALAVTEGSGLLSRDSYLTCLLSEADRMRTQKTPLSVVLLGFAQPPGSASHTDASAARPAANERRYLEEVIQKFSAAAAAHLRQNDIAVRYASDKLALILPGATGQDAASVAEKMRKLVYAVRAKNDQGPPLITAGIAEAARDESMDSTDRITELVNRLEWALDATQQAGGSQVKLLDPPMLPR